MDEIKISARSYDEAITKALLELKTTSDHLDVKVIEEGSAGLFGVLGGKNWVITARALSDEEAEEKARQVKETEDNKFEDTVEEIKKEYIDPVVKDVKETASEVIDDVKEFVTPIAKDIKETASEVIDDVADFIGLGDDKTEKNNSSEDAGETEDNKAPLVPVSEEEVADMTAKAKKFLDDMFRAMNMAVTIDSTFNHNDNELNIILSGDDMGVLIGKRGQTLDAIQYLVSLVVNKDRDNYIRVKLDSENYRARREEKLEEFAHNIASKVKRTKRKVELEPMNPYERRVIHSALQNDSEVTTISEGDEPYRHVVVLLKNPPRRRYHKN